MHGNDLLGLILTVLLIVFWWTVAYFIKKNQPFGSFSKEVARKLVHIGVSNFAFFYLYLIESWYIPFAGLIAFAGVNLMIELNTGSRRSMGTVQYPLVMAFIVLMVHLGYGTKQACAAALLGMGYGDGLAALIGIKFGSKKLPGSEKKTYVGSLTVFVVVLAVCLALTGKMLFLCIFTALAATLTEAYTPFGLDNISVPLVIFVMTGLINV